jgi:hypothetical protein
LPVVAHVPHADDLSNPGDGTLWVSSPIDSLLEHVDITAHVSLARLTDPRAPEGMIALPDGRLIVAEQGPDRIVVLHPPSTSGTTLLQLTLSSGNPGIDGLGYDASTGRLLVPDSSQGKLFRIPVTGGVATELASGLGRDVAAAIAPDGSIAVAVEGSAGLVRIPASGGAATPIANVAEADDVLTVRSLLYVTLLNAHEVIAVDLANGRFNVLVSHVDNPQGLEIVNATRLALADTTTGNVVTFGTC